MRAVRVHHGRPCSEAYTVSWVSAGALTATLAALVIGCSVNGAPSANGVRSAYLRHLRQNALEAQWFGGPEADHSEILISAEQPSCESDGDGHYHCQVGLLKKSPQASLVAGRDRLRRGAAMRPVARSVVARGRIASSQPMMKVASRFRLMAAAVR